MQISLPALSALSADRQATGRRQAGLPVVGRQENSKLIFNYQFSILNLISLPDCKAGKEGNM